MREVYLLQIVGGDRMKLVLLLPVSLVLNTVFALFAGVLKLLVSLLNPILLIATLVDIPIVLIQVIFGSIVTVLRGQRVVPADDFSVDESELLEDGEEIQNRIYGRCRLLERRFLNGNNIEVGRFLPRHLESKVGT